MGTRRRSFVYQPESRACALVSIRSQADARVRSDGCGRSFRWRSRRWLRRCHATWSSSQVDETLKLSGAHRMVTGHTPQDRVLTRCGGRLQVIDTGISRAYDGKATAWECRAGRLFEVTKEGRRPLPSGISDGGDGAEAADQGSAGVLKEAPADEEAADY